MQKAAAEANSPIRRRFSLPNCFMNSLLMMAYFRSPLNVDASNGGGHALEPQLQIGN